MSSPFSTLEEFNGAIDGPTGGAIYTFAGSPAINNIALLVAVAIFFWFIYATYSTHHDLPSVDKSLTRLSSFIVVGLLSLVAIEQLPQNHRAEPSAQGSHPSRQYKVSRQTPLGLLGLAGIGLPTLFSSKNKRRKRGARKFRSPQR